MSHPTESLHLNKISATEFTQSRAKINSEVVAEYVEAMQAGDKFPAVIVYEDAGVYHLADGFHRYQAATDAGFTDILAEIHVGNRKDAIRHAVGANAVHGAQRTNADKRKAVSMALDAFPRMVSTDIARLCAVSHFLVDTIRKASALNADEPQVREKTDGTTYTVKPKAPAPTPAPVAAPTTAPCASAPTPEVKTTEVVEQVKVEPSKRLTKKEQERLERQQRLQVEGLQNATAEVYGYAEDIQRCIRAEAEADPDHDNYILHDPADVDKALDLLESHLATNPKYDEVAAYSPLRSAQLCILELQKMQWPVQREFAIARISKLIAELRQARGGAK